MQLPPARGLPAPASPQVDHTRRKLNWGQLGTVTQNLSHNRTKAHTPQKPPPPSSLPSASEAQREDSPYGQQPLASWNPGQGAGPAQHQDFTMGTRHSHHLWTALLPSSTGRLSREGNGKERTEGQSKAPRGGCRGVSADGSSRGRAVRRPSGSRLASSRWGQGPAGKLAQWGVRPGHPRR